MPPPAYAEHQPAVEERTRLPLAQLPAVVPGARPGRPGGRRRPGPGEEGLEAVDADSDRRAAAHAARQGERGWCEGWPRAVSVKGPSLASHRRGSPISESAASSSGEKSKWGLTPFPLILPLCRLLCCLFPQLPCSSFLPLSLAPVLLLSLPAFIPSPNSRQRQSCC